MRRKSLNKATCPIARALDVIGDWWSLLIVRDVAGGRVRFDELQAELGVSRKVLSERLKTLVDHDVLELRPYSEHPPRHEYHLSARGRGLLPVLIALQDWGARFLMGDGALTATTSPRSDEARRIRALVGRRVPQLALSARGGAFRDPLPADRWTVLYCFPGAYAPGHGSYPEGWSDIPGARGCTIESRMFRDSLELFGERNAEVVGISTQRPDELAGFAEHERIGFPLLSDANLELAAALRLPTFRAAGGDRLKRLTLIIDTERVVRGALYPVADPATAAEEALAMLRSRQGRARQPAASTG
jgi:DNA-binding HxlR family transcriptional regulator/peroxiredoxin